MGFIAHYPCRLVGQRDYFLEINLEFPGCSNGLWKRLSLFVKVHAF